MSPISAPFQYSGPRTTSDANAEGRLKVDVSQKKKKILKRRIKK